MPKRKKPETEVDRLVAGLYTAEEKKDMVEWAEQKAMEAKLREQEEKAAERLYIPPPAPPVITEEERRRLTEEKKAEMRPWTVIFGCPDGRTVNVTVPKALGSVEAETLAKRYGRGIRGCSVKEVKEARAV